MPVGSARPHLALLNATPAQRERMSIGMKQWWADRKLPEMTPQQRWKYRTIREVAGKTEALRRVLEP